MARRKFLDLLAEVAIIQERLTSTITLNEISRILMQKNDVSGALKLLSNNMNNKILSSDDDTLVMLEQKYPDSKRAIDDVLLDRPLVRIHPILYDIIDENMNFKAATITKGGSGPSGLDADGLRTILCSFWYNQL